LKCDIVVTCQKTLPEANRELDALNQLAWDTSTYALSTWWMIETSVMNTKMRAIAAGRTANVHQEGPAKRWVIVALMRPCEE
jgi:hypothetical protein